MQCQHCKQQAATIHLTEITNGQRQETHLCEDCAQQQGLAIKNQVPINELLSTLLSSQGASAQPAEKAKSSKQEPAPAALTCPACGMTFEQFRKETLLGCPADYEVFKAPLLRIIEKAQAGSTSHCGKVPARAPSDNKRYIKILNLRKELQSAINNENYEKAAEIRDRIEHLQ